MHSPFSYYPLFNGNNLSAPTGNSFEDYGDFTDHYGRVTNFPGWGNFQGLPGNQGGFPGFPEFPEFPGGGFLGNPPFNPPGLPPSGPSPGGQGQGQPPTTPPPSFVPQSQPQGQVQLYAVDPGAIRRCLFKFTYVWLERGRRAFWFYPTYVGRRSIAGYRWTGFMWVYYGIDLDRIESFQCY